jgi:hypothetical protein
MKALVNWRNQVLAPESRARLDALLDFQRNDSGDTATRDTLLEAFLITLSETQLQVFARLLTEMTEHVH